MKPKKILFIEFLKITTANHLLMMIKGLVKHDYCSIVVLCQKGSLLARELKNMKVTVYEISYVGLILRNPTTYIPFLSTLIFIFYIIRKHNINIIHCHRLHWAYLGIIPSMIFQIPLFVHIVAIQELPSKLQNILLQLHKNINYITVSKNSREDFFYLHKIPRKRIFYHYGGLFLPDMIKSQNKKIDWLEKMVKKHIIIAMVSRVDPLKGVDVFIEASAILIKKFPYLQFIHVGNHSEYVFQQGYYEDCLKRVNNLGIKHNFIFKDYTEEILSYYKYFYLLALPTFSDTLSYVNLEANFNRVPVIFTKIDGVMETSKIEFNSFIPYPPSPTILARKAEELLLDNKKYLLLKDKVYKNTLKYFDAEKNALNLMKIYEKANSAL